MIRGYADFYYNVTDMKKAIHFYKSALQMTVVFSDEYWTTMKVGNLTLGLHWSEGSTIPLTKRDSHGQACGGTLTFASSDVKEDRVRIERNGGKILGESVQPWGHMLVFEDVDGNVLKLKG
jgi:predicted enzyme related to lactoylglutathione lyase